MRMRGSWETGHVWVAYAASRRWVLYGIYWRDLDQLFLYDE